MNRSRFGSLAALLLSALMASTALLGPLAFGIIDVRISSTMQNQLIGGEVVALMLIAPISALAGVLWLRTHPLAPVLAMGPALYALYTYPQFVIGPDYSRYAGNHEYFFPLYLVLIVAGWGIAVLAWRDLGFLRLPTPARGARWLLAMLLITSSVIFLLAWTASIVDVLSGGAAVQEYEKDPTLFWMIRMLDLGFVMPAAFITAWGLIRQAPWGTRLAGAFTGFQTLLVAAVAGMAVTMAVRDDPAANDALLFVTVVMTVAFAAGYGLLLRHVHARNADPAGSENRRSSAGV